MRYLWSGTQAAGNNVWGAVVWSIAIIVVFAPLAVWRYPHGCQRRPVGLDPRRDGPRRSVQDGP